MGYFDKYRIPILLLIIAIGVAFRIVYSQQATIFRDEALFLSLAADTDSFPGNLNGTPFQGVPPLIVILAKAGESLFGAPRAFILTIQILSSILFILFFYLICGIVCSNHVIGLCGALFASTFYRFIEYGGAAMRDGFYLTTVAGILYFVLRERREPEKKKVFMWTGAFICAAIGMICRREGLEELLFLLYLIALRLVLERKWAIIKPAAVGIICFLVIIAAACITASEWCNYDWNPIRSFSSRLDWISRNIIKGTI